MSNAYDSHGASAHARSQVANLGFWWDSSDAPSTDLSGGGKHFRSPGHSAAASGPPRALRLGGAAAGGEMEEEEEEDGFFKADAVN